MQFDPALFIHQETTEALVRRPPLPVQDYVATIGAVTAATWNSNKGGVEKSGVRFSVPLKLEVPPQIQQELNLSQSTIQLTDSIMLDVTEAGTIDWSIGKNTYLRKYREALDMNKAGEVFSPAKMEGRMLTVKIAHEIWQGETQERIGGVARLG